jgi:2'-5' RNA ligase
MPPRNLWAPFVEIKKNHMNPKIKRPPYPHITLFAPFVHPKYFKEAKSEFREILKNIEPFEINFANFECFKNDFSSTLYLVPESTNEISQVYKSLINCLPANIVQKQNNFEPHIGVGYFKGKDNEADILQNKYQSNWIPLKFMVQEIYFIRRKSKESPWEIEEIVSLGEKELDPLFNLGETTDSTK